MDKPTLDPREPLPMPLGWVKCRYCGAHAPERPIAMLIHHWACPALRVPVRVKQWHVSTSV